MENPAKGHGKTALTVRSGDGPSIPQQIFFLSVSGTGDTITIGLLKLVWKKMGGLDKLTSQSAM